MACMWTNHLQLISEDGQSMAYGLEVVRSLGYNKKEVVTRLGKFINFVYRDWGLGNLLLLGFTLKALL